jgi:hypothetical protein
MARRGKRRKKRHWIADAIKHPGAFSAKAKAEGESTAEFAKEKEDAKGLLGRQARLAQTLMHLNRR